MAMTPEEHQASSNRAKALELAVQVCGPDRSPANVLKAAEAFADFLDHKRDVGTGRVRMVSGEVQPAALGS